MTKKFAVIGGDMRQARLCELLAQDGISVSSFAIDNEEMDSAVKKESTLTAALAGAFCIILPLPAASKGMLLNTPLSDGAYKIEDVFNQIGPEQLVCAGRVTEELRALAEKKNIRLLDYLSREEMAVKNAVATAEGAIQLAMEEMPITLCHAKCLVVGFGRIGKMLSQRLWGLGAQVTVSARSFGDRAWISAYGYGAENTAKLHDRLSTYDLIVNTVPARILDAAHLSGLKPGCLCIDLASKPGGMDFAAAADLGLKAIWALSLPGKVAPVTSGMIIRDTIYNIAEEQGVAL